MKRSFILDVLIRDEILYSRRNKKRNSMHITFKKAIYARNSIEILKNHLIGNPGIVIKISKPKINVLKGICTGCGNRGHWWR